MPRSVNKSASNIAVENRISGSGTKRKFGKTSARDDTPCSGEDNILPTKRRRFEYHSGEISNGEVDKDRDQEQKGPSKRGYDEEEKRKFACPYFKHDPLKYGRKRSCAGPGWDSNHRLKEHLYRIHAAPPICPRCGNSFSSDAAVMDHLITCEGCKIDTSREPEGFTVSQGMQLRLRASRLGTEEEKWKKIYAILFPKVPESDIPSPYYDLNPPEHPVLRNQVTSSILDGFEAFCINEFGPRLRRKLGGLYDKMLEDSCRIALTDMLEDFKSKTLRTNSPESSAQKQVNELDSEQVAGTAPDRVDLAVLDTFEYVSGRAISLDAWQVSSYQDLGEDEVHVATPTNNITMDPYHTASISTHSTETDFILDNTSPQEFNDRLDFEHLNDVQVTHRSPLISTLDMELSFC